MVNFLPTVRLAQSISKHKFPCIDKPLQIIIRPSKRAFEKYKPQGLFSEFYRCLILVRASFFIVFDPCTVVI